MGKIFPCSVKKPPVRCVSHMKCRPQVDISYYNYSIINILGFGLFIYMYWRNTCKDLIATRNKPPLRKKLKGIILTETGNKEDRGSEKRFKESAANCLTFSHHLLRIPLLDIVIKINYTTI